ncbi:cytochrome c maturation protein CcmE [Ehrlichia canis]|uniref:Cytochrome c-type biogenesis protein CcmE n=1 Tax=Ehrlichia canis (strain Jake) TaxID=269484 RepID=CCME_EHRCJ|nr:cytochrome c maturation protein CcmE [Ehrlichia canis]Q3YSH2.1 RecName: Full=Cytochrome c-type biogenesis protein CcmE; AltName: Full=Cytochrome c maturation protein E; AltName: Full=Heme chaperone CcmE [Ehrlichia canis str. Jake]AAZ68333.1 CcmE/CycJ protein [Ehrlichia canis str. Jake]AUO54907.1 cytochrome c-type biogenesis protein CcmE [Ehrlichia canis]UKC53738.1 ccmE [Ehrlichia canis]UKC54676.1 ccmE [Ehrlichia canis]UKC55612.1 ccmE [Ehrlichia canis]
MKRKHKRLLFIIVTFIIFGSSVVIVLNKLRSNISFFFTPTEVLSGSINVSSNDIRIGGMVISGSLKRYDNLISFFITDLESQIKVVYQGILPPLFSEGSWVVAKGKMVNGEFNANEILAKHDENYKPGKYRAK